jgi:RNA-binding protein YlmH
MMAGLKINRNRMPQVVNMKLYKMNNRKTDQDKNKKQENDHAQGHGKTDLDAEVSFSHSKIPHTKCTCLEKEI